MQLKIKELRKVAGLTQQEMADRIGVAQSYFAELENGKKTANMVRLKAISEALNVPVTDLFERPADASHSEFIGIFESLTAEQQEVVLAMMRSLTQASEQTS